MPVMVGVDIGGTFADFVALEPETGQLRTLKVLTTPQAPGRDVAAGLERLAAEGIGLGVLMLHIVIRRAKNRRWNFLTGRRTGSTVNGVVRPHGASRVFANARRAGAGGFATDHTLGHFGLVAQVNYTHRHLTHHVASEMQRRLDGRR